MLTLIPLGTSSAVPTRERALSGTVVEREGRLFLFDSGEGVQHRFLDSGLRPTRLEAVFISHLHGDHFFGLFGLLSTLELLHRTRPLTLVGPPELDRALETIFGLTGGRPRFEIRYLRVDEDAAERTVFDGEGLRVASAPLDHRTFCLGYRMEEKPRPGKLDVERARELGIVAHEQIRALKEGRSVSGAGGRPVLPEEVLGPPQTGASLAYCFDTRPCPSAVRLARDVDLLYHDATFDEAFAERAAQTGHSTGREAATVAREAGARRLLLGHFSSRYGSVDHLVDQAREVFAESEAAVELRRYEIG